MGIATALWQETVRQGFDSNAVQPSTSFLGFLVFALFLPRVSLVVAWLQGILLPFHLVGWIPLIFAILLPRALVLYLIYLDQGLSLWFVIHLVVGNSGVDRGRTYLSKPKE